MCNWSLASRARLLFEIEIEFDVMVNTCRQSIVPEMVPRGASEPPQALARHPAKLFGPMAPARSKATPAPEECNPAAGPRSTSRRVR
jgi:hypothetical protein